jgi:hypothetical protein
MPIFPSIKLTPKYDAGNNCSHSIIAALFLSFLGQNHSFPNLAYYNYIYIGNRKLLDFLDGSSLKIFGF